MREQLSIFDFFPEFEPVKVDEELVPKLNINFSCFSTFRSEAGGVRYGECAYNHDCSECEAYQAFYEKADEYKKTGEAWGVSVALAKEFFKIPTVPEYTVAAERNGLEFRDLQWQPRSSIRM